MPIYLRFCDISTNFVPMVKGGKVLVITLCHFKSMFNAIVITDCTTVDKCNTCCDQLIFSVCYYLDISNKTSHFGHSCSTFFLSLLLVVKEHVIALMLAAFFRNTACGMRR